MALCFLYMGMRPQAPEPPPKDPTAKSTDPLLNPNAPKTGESPEATVETSGDAAEVPAAVFPEKVVTLGSLDPTKNSKLLVTISSRGAGVERVELVEQEKPGKFKFRALEFDGSYIGYLSGKETTSGLLVRSIPDGSPAQAAGLNVGDTITKVNGITVTVPADLEGILADIKPGSQLEIQVSRDGPPSTLTATTTAPPLDMVRTTPWSSEQVPGNISRRALMTTLGALNQTKVPETQASLPALAPAFEENWEVKPLDVANGEGYEFSIPLAGYLKGTGRPSDLVLVKRYRLVTGDTPGSGYDLDVETLVRNRNDEEVSVALRQEGLSGLTLEGWWYSVKISPYMFSGAGNRDVISNSRAAGHKLQTTRQIQDRAKKNPLKPSIMMFSEDQPIEARSLSYIGVDAQYFNASIRSHPDDPESLTDLRRAGTMAVADASLINKSQAQATNTSFWFDTQEQKLAPGEELSQRYIVYLGPKDTQMLEDRGLDRAIEYGWFKWVAKPLGWILHFFYDIVRNYGLAIVMLTVLVRGCMFPLGRKAAMNAQRMQELQPEIKKLNERYSDSMERAQAMQALYKKHNFKPLAGCLPMFVQLPIFLGLYRCLSVDISLRQQPLIPGLEWCSNLAGPDQLINWSSWMPEFIAGRGTGWLGPYFNILPMVTVALFLLQQQMLMPKATDDQTRITQNMMKVMTVFMGVLFFKVPAGLCIYFITSSLWSLLERKLVKRMTPPPSTPIDDSPETSKPNKSSGKSSSKNRRRSSAEAEPKKLSKLEELRRMMEQQQGSNSTTVRGSSKGNRQNRKKRKK